MLRRCVYPLARLRRASALSLPQASTAVTGRHSQPLLAANCCCILSKRLVAATSHDSSSGNLPVISDVTSELKSESSQDSVPEVTVTEPQELSTAVVDKNEVTLIMESGIVTMKKIESYKAISEMNSEQVLDLADNSYDLLNKTHAALSLKRLVQLSRDRARTQHFVPFKETVAQDPRFQVLCALVAKKGPHLDPGIAADMFRFLSSFRLDSSHPAVQVYLQLLKYYINDLFLSQLVALSHSLSFMTPTEQTHTLMEAIRVLLKANWDVSNEKQAVQILGDLDRLKPWTKARLLVLHGNVFSEEFHKTVLNHIWSDIQRGGRENRNQTLTFLRVLPLAKYFHNELCRWCVNSLAGDFRQGRLYPEKLILTLEILYDLLKCNAQLDVDSIVKTCEVLGEAALGLTDSQHEQLCELLTKCTAEGLDVHTALDLCLHLAALQRPLPMFLMDVLQSTVTVPPTALQTTDWISRREKMALLNIRSTDAGQPSELDSELDQLRAARRGQLSDCLHNLYQQDHTVTVQEHVHALNALYIDHLLTIQNEDQEREDNTLRIAVLMLPGTCFHVKTMIMKGLPRLYASSLENEGYEVVVVNEDTWSRVQEEQKQATLAHMIEKARNRCGEPSLYSLVPPAKKPRFKSAWTP